MTDETKAAVRKAFNVGRILFFMGSNKYNKLLKATSEVRLSKTKVDSFIKEGRSTEEAMVYVLRDMYGEAAISAGFTRKQGIAMLEYAAMLEELK